MGFAKDYPAFTATVAILVVAFFAGAFLNYSAASKVSKAESSLKRTESQLNNLLNVSPALTEENLKSVQSNVADLKVELDKRLQATRGRVPNLIASQPPTTGTEMLFQFESYSEQFANDAKASNITLPEDFAFGFSRYIESGVPPVEADIPQLYQQKEVLTYLLRKLYNSQIHGITAIKREPVVEVTSKKDKTLADEFTLSDELSARSEGAIETFAVEIHFSGYTAALRTFLTQIEQFELPLVVQGVEVKPTEGQKTTTASSSNAFDSFFGGSNEVESNQQPAGQVPVVENNESEFIVTIEYVNVVSTDFAVAQVGPGEGFEDEEDFN